MTNHSSKHEIISLVYLAVMSYSFFEEVKDGPEKIKDGGFFEAHSENTGLIMDLLRQLNYLKNRGLYFGFSNGKSVEPNEIDENVYSKVHGLLKAFFSFTNCIFDLIEEGEDYKNDLEMINVIISSEKIQQLMKP